MSVSSPCGNLISWKVSEKSNKQFLRKFGKRLCWPQNCPFGPISMETRIFSKKWPCKFLALVVIYFHEKFHKKVMSGFWENSENSHFGPKIVLLGLFPWKQQFSQKKGSCQSLALMVLKHYGRFQEESMNGFWEISKNDQFRPKIVLLAPFPWKKEFSQ